MFEINDKKFSKFVKTSFEEKKKSTYNMHSYKLKDIVNK